MTSAVDLSVKDQLPISSRLFQLRADSVQDLSLVDQFSPKSRNFPGELFRLRSLSEVSETMATIAKAACQRKRHSFSVGGCNPVSHIFRWRSLFFVGALFFCFCCWFVTVGLKCWLPVAKCPGEIFSLMLCGHCSCFIRKHSCV